MSRPDPALYSMAGIWRGRLRRRGQAPALPRDGVQAPGGGSSVAARTGIVLIGVYLVVAAATALWAPGGLRPLFDGFGSHPGYNWVNPPREFAEGNLPPESSKTDVQFDASGSLPISSGPNDGQALAALVPKAVAPHPPDESATLTLTPVDAGTLGPLPAGLRAEGNAYRVAIEYQPSGVAVTELAEPGTVGLTAAAPADTLLYSTDGRVWEKQVGQPIPNGNGLTAQLRLTGYYLAASPGPPRPLGGSGSGSGAVLLVVAGLAVAAAVAWLLLSKRRPARGGRRPPPRARGGAKPGGKPAGKSRPAGKGQPPAKGGKRPPPKRR